MGPESQRPEGLRGAVVQLLRAHYAHVHLQTLRAWLVNKSFMKVPRGQSGVHSVTPGSVLVRGLRRPRVGLPLLPSRRGSPVYEEIQRFPLNHRCVLPVQLL